MQVVEDIGKAMEEYTIVVTKSTVPVGTNRKLKEIIAQHYKGAFEIISNPEFLQEGLAIEGFMHPDRIIIGYDSDEKAAHKVAELYKPFNAEVVITNLETAEMIKYASNAFLATEISFINTIARLCEQTGADVTKVSEGMKLDKRIGQKAFLNAGVGYGGSCFPKDVQALVRIAKTNKVNFKILKEVESVNKEQRQRFILKIKNVLGDVNGKRIAVLGVAFKPGTDDIREAPAITIIEGLLSLGAAVSAYDPIAQKNAKRALPDVSFSKNIFSMCKNADAVVIITDWKEFRDLDWTKIAKAMKTPIVFDGRNMFLSQEMNEKNIRYFSIGR
ncbi:MAG: UDP-glucose/GDP-mannose dehydrogenase family protein [bacterium]